jgi:Protein of unknown function (DUF4031)
MVDALFQMESRDPQARFIGTRTGHRWCHLWCNPGDEEILHATARALGLKRAWFQDKAGFPHYDLVPGKRARALEIGAVETSLVDWLRARRSSNSPV